MGLSRLAVYNHAVKKSQVLAALHFELEENSLEEVMLEVKHQYENLESELLKKLPPIFQWVESSERVLMDMGIWQQMPEEMQSSAYDALLESVARCTKRQISKIQVHQRATLPKTFGRQFSIETNFCVVEFVYNSKILPFAVTATKIKK